MPRFCILKNFLRGVVLWVCLEMCIGSLSGTPHFMPTGVFRPRKSDMRTYEEVGIALDRVNKRIRLLLCLPEGEFQDRYSEYRHEVAAEVYWRSALMELAVEEILAADRAWELNN